MSGKHKLYYSTRCRFCQAFLEELARTPFVPEFQLVCVDPAPGRPPLPPWLKSVPAMMVQGEGTPRVGPGPVNNWLFERKLGGGGTPKSPQAAYEERNSITSAPPVYNPDMAPRPHATARTAAPDRSAGSAPTAAKTGAGGLPDAGTDGPAAYHNSEMGATKWSDNYSFLGGAEFTSDKGYDPIGRNFESLLPAGALSGGGGATSAVSSGPKRTAKEDELLRQFEAFSAARDKDVPGPLARM